jgi:hypothetical protein
VNLVNRAHDVRPDDTILIIDESIYCLDILEVAFHNMFDPVCCFLSL